MHAGYQRTNANERRSREAVETRLRSTRSDHGWSQARLISELTKRAKATGTPIATQASLKPLVSRWENGHTVPDEVYRRLFRELYGRTDAELGFTQEATPVSGDNARDELLARLASARSVDTETVRLMEGQIDNVRRLDRRLGAPALLEQMRAHITTLQDLLSHTVLPATREPLAGVLADAGTLAAWQALDVGATGQAWGHYEIAKMAARESGSPSLLAHAMGEQAFALLDLDRGHDAVALIHEAQRVGRGQLPSLLSAWLHAAEAEACAATGDEFTCRRALDEATRTLPGDTNDPTLPFIALDETHLARWRGHSLARIGNEDATRDLYNAVEKMDTTFTRAEAGLRCDLAHALTLRGERDEAQTQAVRARKLAAQVGSVRQRRRIERLVAA